MHGAVKEEYVMSSYVSTKSRMNIHTIAKVSILGALSCLIMLLEFPLPIAPPFYQIDFSEVVVLIGGFALGPWAAVCIEALKIVLNLLINGTITMGVGEFANFLIGCALVVPAVLIYQREKTKKHALTGLLTGIVAMTIVGALVNFFILIPAYTTFANIPMEVIMGMGKAVNPNVNGLAALIMICVVPFNLIKGALVSAVVFLSYKKVSPLLKK